MSNVAPIVAGVQHGVPPQPHKGPLKLQSLYELVAPRFKDWHVAAGIVGAESDYDPNARSPNPDGGENRGLFQIDTKTAKGHGLNPDLLFIPSYNVYAAWVISKHGTDWHPWAVAYGNPRDPSTYLADNAPFRKHIKDDQAKLPEADSAGFLGVFGSGKSAGDFSSPLEAVKAIWNALTAPKTWLRVLEFIGGILLGYFALRQLAAAAQA